MPHGIGSRAAAAIWGAALVTALGARAALAANACLVSFGSGNGNSHGLNVQGHVGATAHGGFAGDFNIQIDGVGQTVGYCVDLLHTISPGNCEGQVPPQYDCRVTYILNNFYPHGAVPGGETVDQEAASVQSAIWFFTDNFTLDAAPANPAIVVSRTAAIIAAANAQSPTGCVNPNVPNNFVLSPLSATNYIPPQTSHTVTGTLFGTNAQPLPGWTVSVGVAGAGGPITPQSFTTDANGQVVYTYTNAHGVNGIGTDTITFSATFSVPVGLEFKDATHQGIVLAGTPQTGTVTGTAHKTWAEATCGDGILHNTPGEECDDGNHVNGDGCDANCTVTRCGNGIVTAGEVCDDGNTVSGDGCDANCTVTACGNGIVTAGEVCDDGNLASGDGCDSNCTPTACGNGIQTAGEQCDDGNHVNGDSCENDCTIPRCGNGIVDVGEQCDDGNASNADGCLDTCVPATCGDGFVRTGVEQCDDGNHVDGDACEANCTTPFCGNGIVDQGETCDDGNATNGDGCDVNCTAPGCGNHVVDPGEQCDDGNGINGDACDNNCTDPGPGNGITDPGEQCDDGNLTPGDGCSPTGQLEICGNGVVDPGEECDDGNASDTDACRTNCVANVCGDGIVNIGVEECDDGNQVNDDGCRNDCRLAVCGDGVVAPGIEQCDDGNLTPGDGCSPTCTITEICNDFEDNDNDGLIDCDDPDCPTCPPIQRDPATQKNYPPPKPDYVKIEGGVLQPALTDPSTVRVGFLLTNANGVLFRQILPAGSMTRARAAYPRFLYVNKLARKLPGGIYLLQLGLKNGIWHVTVKSFGETANRATLATMSAQLLIDDVVYFNHATWTKTRVGWDFKFRETPR